MDDFPDELAYETDEDFSLLYSAAREFFGKYDDHAAATRIVLDAYDDSQEEEEEFCENCNEMAKNAHLN